MLDFLELVLGMVGSCYDVDGFILASGYAVPLAGAQVKKECNTNC